MNKLKVIWICHFTNPEIREVLPLTKKRKYYDFSPWITNMIPYFEQKSDIELHIVAPHRGLKRLTYCFEKRGILYHFFKPDVPIVHRNWPSFFPLHRWTKYLRNRFLVHRFIRKTKPDIVNLHGAENDYYSITALDVKNIPLYICIQGIYSNPIRFQKLREDVFRSKIERQIHSKYKYFGVRAPFMVDLIRRDAENPIFFWQNYPLAVSNLQVNKIHKKYDFVFFAQITPTKGIEELIDAMNIVKQEFNNVTLNIIGMGSKAYIKYLKEKIKNLELSDNVTFTGALPTIKVVHQEAVKARFSVIPTKLDTIPGTITESILLALPVISCKTGGIPFLNKDTETILLSEPGDIKGLADNMIKYMRDPDYAEMLSIRAKNFVMKEFGGEKSVDRLCEQYRQIIAHYGTGKPISKELLFEYNWCNND